MPSSQNYSKLTSSISACPCLSVVRFRKMLDLRMFICFKSFRFGPEIAYVASCVLDVLKGIRNKTIVGGAKKGIYVLLCSCAGLFSIMCRRMVYHLGVGVNTYG